MSPGRTTAIGSPIAASGEVPQPGRFPWTAELATTPEPGAGPAPVAAALQKEQEAIMCLPYDCRAPAPIGRHDPGRHP